jgi:hypothetical protein
MPMVLDTGAPFSAVAEGAAVLQSASARRRTQAVVGRGVCRDGVAVKEDRAIEIGLGLRVSAYVDVPRRAATIAGPACGNGYPNRRSCIDTMRR